jgi:tRNA threonylcarbamoyladenosine biosynthesis protein TsaB
MLLSIETSTNTCSVALHYLTNGEICTYLELQVEKAHSSFLTVLIEQALYFSGITMQDIKAVAVSSGPGSYTGLRIGVSASKGFCYALQIPLISVNALEAMSWEVISYYPQHEEIILCPMIDARRMEVYTALYDIKGTCLKNTHPLIVEENSFDFEPTKKIIFFGNGASKCKKVLKNNNFYFLENINPTAKWVGNIALKKFQKQDFEDVAYFEPDYLKEFMTSTPKAKI